MSLMPSLCAALERAGGDRLVMRAGERPHVLAGTRRHDVASAVLSINAVEALAEQILSSAGRQELAVNGAVSETVHSPSFPHPLTARAERVGEDFCIELIVSLAIETAPTSPPEPEAEQPETEQLPAQPATFVEPAPPSFAPSEPLAVAAAPAVEPELASEPLPVAEPQGLAESEPEPPPMALTPVDIGARHEERERAPEAPVDDIAPERPDVYRRPEVTVVARLQEQVRPSRPAVHMQQDLLTWIGHASELGATTLYLRAGSPAAARIDERIQPISDEPVDSSVIEEAAGAFTRGGDGVWEPRPDGEWVREDDEIGYVSCRIFADVQGQGLIVQLRPSTSLRLLHKHIPRQVRAACEGNGLVVVTASTETDVEALAAAVADWSGRDRGGYLISLQRRTRSHDSIAGAFVSQRTVAGSEKDFAAAIRRATQENPDILLVTGLQTEQPLQAAVLAAAGGRLVIVGVVAPTTVEALRMLAGSDPHVRRAMAASFRAAIGYRSLRRIGGGRTLVQDVILAGTTVCGLMEAGDFEGLARTQRDGAPGMRSVDESLARAVRRRHISLREAAAQSIDRSHMVALVRAQARTGSAARAGGSHEAQLAHPGRRYGDRIAAAGGAGRYSRA